MNISGADSIKLLDLRVQMYRDLFVSLYKLTGKKDYCGNHGEGNKEMIIHSNFNHRKYPGSAVWKEEVRYV